MFCLKSCGSTFVSTTFRDGELRITSDSANLTIMNIHYNFAKIDEDTSVPDYLYFNFQANEWNFCSITSYSGGFKKQNLKDTAQSNDNAETNQSLKTAIEIVKITHAIVLILDQVQIKNSTVKEICGQADLNVLLKIRKMIRNINETRSSFQSQNQIDHSVIMQLAEILRQYHETLQIALNPEYAPDSRTPLLKQ